MTCYVIGNQAADADSLISSICCAQLLNFLQNTNEYQAVLSCTREDFKLRNDVVELFRLAGWKLEKSSSSIAPEGVLFIDDVKTAVENVVLTDANVIGPHIQQLGSNIKVKAIYDHHRDEKMYLDASPRWIDEACGSACSMLANDLLKNNCPCPGSFYILMYGVILLDTRNLEPGRTFDPDRLAIKELSMRLPENIINNQDQIYKQLMDARNDVSHLSFSDLLRLDYKEVSEHETKVGFSTLFEPYGRLLDPARKVEESMMEMMEKKSLHALFAITSVEADSDRRGFVICTKSSKVHDNIVHDLKAPPQQVFSESFLSLPLCHSQKIVERGFGLEPISQAPSRAPKSPKASHGFSLWTVNGAITRKTMFPALLEILSRLRRV
jgi:inorganic pyrophosphatase/exopolyphosphatase